MLYSLPDTILVIDPDIANPWYVRSDIDKHQWHVAEPEVLEQRVLHAECKNGNSINSAFNHAPHR